MVKFILEVSDGYIRERADLDNIQKSNSENVDFKKMLMEFMTFGSLEKQLNEGKTEFMVSSSFYKDQKELELFNETLTRVAALCLVAKANTVEK